MKNLFERRGTTFFNVKPAVDYLSLMLLSKHATRRADFDHQIPADLIPKEISSLPQFLDNEPSEVLTAIYHDVARKLIDSAFFKYPTPRKPTERIRFRMGVEHDDIHVTSLPDVLTVYETEGSTECSFAVNQVFRGTLPIAEDVVLQRELKPRSLQTLLDDIPDAVFTDSFFLPIKVTYTHDSLEPTLSFDEEFEVLGKGYQFPGNVTAAQMDAMIKRLHVVNITVTTDEVILTERGLINNSCDLLRNELFRFLKTYYDDATKHPIISQDLKELVANTRKLLTSLSC